MQEKEQRVKYVRALERFVKSAAALLKREDFNLELFILRMQKNYTVLSKVPAVSLDSPYTRALEDYVNFVLETIKNPQEKEVVLQVLLKEANAIQKLKTTSSYKKNKHRSKIYDDGY
ncbi:hypothetical protein JWV37_05255 [Sulfurospirillum sp. T05]|uniref:Uncharacterized protein n=1 Tax=Sulfurospirillum tamanense TaxID=2813362 RepID=A0ABS2WS31_9BACT|nr:hypothetical protein [Sulfurospirillum tamanensis]